MRLLHRIAPVLSTLLVVAATHAAGVLARFEQAGRIDALALPNAALFFPAEAPPTSLLTTGNYRIQLEGFVSVDLRAQYAFQIEASGAAELMVNGNPVLNFAGGGTSELSKPVRLNKGPNALLVKLASTKEPVQFRLLWKSRSMAQAIPIPSSALTYDENDSVLRRNPMFRKGLAAFAEYRCARCHKGGREPEIDSPDLTQVGSRLRRDWMAEWIAKPNWGMPAVVFPEEAREIADYLGTLGAPPTHSENKGNSASGEKLFHALQCAKCHDETALDHVGAKFAKGALKAYLLNPQEHYRWNRMPNFRLSKEEAGDLAAFLARRESAATDERKSSRGKELLETRGCMNCHNGPVQTTLSAKPLDQIARKPASGCLDLTNSLTPRFNFAEGEREALALFLETIRTNRVGPASPLETALDRTSALGCARCHDSTEGVIRLEAMGGKLRPEWVAAFLGDEIKYKPRPWLPARMPSFSMHAHELAAGLAALHGIPPATPVEKPVNSTNAAVGAKLVSAAGGFSCVACHAVGASSGSVVVESPGINLAYSGERLLKSFFHRWVMNPIAIDPATKMPVYFDENGRSQLVEILDGDGTRQIEAMWEYLRLGPKMPAPPVP